MADLKQSTYDSVVPVPSGDFAATSGGHDLGSGPSGGLVGSPFSQALVSPPAGKETPNSMSGLPVQVTTVSVDGAPSGTVESPSLMDHRKNVGS